jgi:glycosyltransferase involved in cell wall biosynthesis
MSSTAPLVSVVVPTFGRPTLLLRALTSVFGQTYETLEVIVVVDGPDEATIAALKNVRDARLRVLVNSRSLAAAGARNIGVDNAKGAWIAFLDDDDEWLPDKLEKQVQCASGRDDILVSCVSRLATGTRMSIRPESIYDGKSPLDEYLFDRASLRSSIGFIQTSSYFLSRSLYDRVRFIVGPHDDWDFVLRASKIEKARIEMLPDVLVVVHVDEQRPSLSTSGTWLASLQWIDSIRPIVTRRAYSGFCFGVVGPRAARARVYRAFVLLIYRAYRYGTPRPWQVLAFVGYWLMPERIIRKVRTQLARQIQL